MCAVGISEDYEGVVICAGLYFMWINTIFRNLLIQH
jgi:hypothetical protein